MPLGILNPVIDLFNRAKFAVLGELVVVEVTRGVLDKVRGGGLHVNTVEDGIGQGLGDLMDLGERTIGKPLLDAILAAGPELTLSDDPSAQESTAVRVLQRLLGFGAILPFATAEAEVAIKALLGEHAPEHVLESIRELPGELGVNFFIGTILERIFEVAVGQPLNEAIATQTRPARLEWPQLRALVRGKVLDPASFREQLAKIGFRDQDIDLIEKLDRQLLSPAELQAAFLQGAMSEAQVRTYLDTLGYTADDAETILQVYLEKAQTEGGSVLKATARRGLLDGHLTQDQFVSILQSVNVPQASIAAELAAAEMAISWGQHQLTVGEVKTLREHGELTDREAVARLQTIGYGEADAQLLVQDWLTAAKVGHPGVTVQRVLSYYLGGVIDAPQAMKLLLDINVKPEDATFMVEHPGAFGGVFAYERKPATVAAAVKAEVLTQDQALAELGQLNVDPEEARLLVLTAAAQVRKGPKPKQASKTLSEAQVLAALNYGLADETWAVAELVTIGYTEAVAQLLIALEITRKGGVVPPGWTTLTGGGATLTDIARPPIPSRQMARQPV